jgi:hypothetical protein
MPWKQTAIASLDPRLRGDDSKNKPASGLSNGRLPPSLGDRKKLVLFHGGDVPLPRW